MSDHSPSLEKLEHRLAELEAENHRLREMLGLEHRSTPVVPWEPTLFPEEETPAAPVTMHSPPSEKLALFRSLFRGRDDVYAERWGNARTGKSGWSPAVKGGWANAKRPDREYLPLDDDVISDHLRGGRHAGLYPLLLDDACRLLVCDFDGAGWVHDALAYMDVARSSGLAVALEQSRSGQGAHVWMFFTEAVPAASARRIGVFLIREAMTIRAELDLSSYDRLFPAQDFLPRQGFGNLIALPLQGECRQRGATVFLDSATLQPYKDQWAFLSSVGRVSRQVVEAMAQSVGELVVGPTGGTYRKAAQPILDKPPPVPIRASAGATLCVDAIGLPPTLAAAFKHAASLPNPEFYEKERNRFWTGKTPRLIRCYRENLGTLDLPRGLRGTVEEIALDAGTRLEVAPAFGDVRKLDFELVTELRADQRAAVDALTGHELSLLTAPPGAGKTVIACALMAHHSVPTLVIVDRQPLVDQWRDRLSEHLALDKKQIGQIGGQRKASGVVDIAMAQSLARRDELAALTASYGLVVVDECHHVPAVTFERAVRQIPVRRWLGLTATPYRRDRLESMMTMYCGPLRHRMAQPESGQLLHRQLLVHQTRSVIPPGEYFQETLRCLIEDYERTKVICTDIAAAAAEGRNCLVLTRWTDHLEAIVSCLAGLGLTAMVLRGGMGKKARRAVIEALAAPGLRGAVLVATSGLIGEGFDAPALDTLFLAFPIKFRGSIVQNVGRVLRPTPSKTEVVVHDYVDVHVPVIARMFDERARGYTTLGFPVPKLSYRSP